MSASINYHTMHDSNSCLQVLGITFRLLTRHFTSKCCTSENFYECCVLEIFSECCVFEIFGRGMEDFILYLKIGEEGGGSFLLFMFPRRLLLRIEILI